MRILLLTAGFFVCMVAQAQVQIGLQTGINSVNWSSTDAHPSPLGETYSTTGAFNLHGGIVSQINLFRRWHMRTGLFLTGKGTTLDHQSYRDTSSLDIWLRYVELPVVFVYQERLGRNIEGFVGAGLYGAYGLYGAAIGDGVRENYGPYSIASEVEFSRENETQVFPPVIPPFDYGYTFLAGLERHRWQLLLAYSQGLKTLLNPKLFYGSYKNRALSLSVAYLIPTKRNQNIFR